MFRDDGFRAACLATLGGTSDLGYAATVEATLDALARHLEEHIDVAGLLGAAR